MRVRTTLILEEETLEKIDEIAGEKQRRARIVERALREYIAKHEKKGTTAASAEKPETNKKPAAKPKSRRAPVGKAAVKQH